MKCQTMMLGFLQAAFMFNTDLNPCRCTVMCFLQHCSPLYVSTVIARSTIGRLCYSAAEIAEASLLATLGITNQVSLVEVLLGASPVLANFQAWTTVQRPVSAMQRLDMTWRLPLQQVLEALAEHLQDTSRVVHILSTPHCWQGRMFQAAISLSTGSGTCGCSHCGGAGSGKAFTSLGPNMFVTNLTEGAMCRVSVEQTIVGVPLQAGRMYAEIF
jgi:hypothetical protein